MSDQAPAEPGGAIGWVSHGVVAMTRAAIALAAGSVRGLGAAAQQIAPIVPGPVRSAATVLQHGARRAGAAAATTADAALRRAIRIVVDAALEELDLADIIVQHVDLDEVAAHLDIDAVAARIDLDAIIDRVEVDKVVERVDVDKVIDRVDLDLIADRLDLDRQVARVNIDVAAERIDIDAIAARMDLNDLASRIDPDPLVARANIDAVIARVDLLALAREIIDGIDLPGIIRQSTGALSSDAVKGVRSQSRSADDAVAGFVGRLFGQGDSRAVTST